jgi:hypothetical protein
MGLHLSDDRQIRQWTSQFRVLALLCADARSGDRTDVVARAASEVRDWTGFEDLVLRHRVVGLAHSSIARCPGAFPPELSSRIAQAASALAFQNLATASETVELQRLFDDAGIAAVFFKGATLAQRAYGTLLSKQSKDVDFIVPTADLTRTVVLLQQRGYLLEYPRPELTEDQWRVMTTFGMEVQMVHARSRMRVEPHWHLTENRALLSTHDLCGAADKAWGAIGNVPIRTLHPDDLFTYLCVHGATAGWFRLKWLADLHALIDAASAEELERLDRHARSRGAGASAALALSMCATVFGREVPAGILKRADGSLWLRRLKALHLLNLRHSEVSPWRAFQGALLLAAAEGRLLAQLDLMMVCPADAIDHPLPRPLHFLYRVMRVPAWLVRWLSTTRRVRSV